MNLEETQTIAACKKKRKAIYLFSLSMEISHLYQNDKDQTIILEHGLKNLPLTNVQKIRISTLYVV